MNQKLLDALVKTLCDVTDIPKAENSFVSIIKSDASTIANKEAGKFYKTNPGDNSADLSSVIAGGLTGWKVK